MDELVKYVLSGSPNSKGATNYIIKNLFQESEIIDLSRADIASCIGCNKCINGDCVYDDDFFKILELVDDYFILVSPIYFLGLPSFVKAFIDRFQVLWNNKNIVRIKHCAMILHGESGNYKIESGLQLLNEIISELLNSEKTFFTILHNFQNNKSGNVENNIIEVKEQLWNAFFVK